MWNQLTKVRHETCGCKFKFSEVLRLRKHCIVKVPFTIWSTVYFLGHKVFFLRKFAIIMEAQQRKVEIQLDMESFSITLSHCNIYAKNYPQII